jgi:hypothetical protein
MNQKIMVKNLHEVVAINTEIVNEVLKCCNSFRKLTTN